MLRSLLLRFFLASIAVCLLGTPLTFAVSAPAQSVAPVLAIEGLGKGVAPLDGPWQFHVGDNAAWASPAIPDTDPTTGWEQITTDKPWGAQGHPAYTGFAWYRKHVHITSAPGAPADIAMLIRQVESVYEIYWNGSLVGKYGHMPPDPKYPFSSAAPQTFGLGPMRDGVLAVRVWRAPLFSFDPNEIGGFYSAPVIGSPDAISHLKASMDYTWLRSRQYSFGLQALNTIIMVLSLILWFRDRSQRVLLAMAGFSGSPVVALVLTGLRIPFSMYFALGWLQPVLSIADISLWYLLLYILKLDENPRLTRFTHLLAIVSFTSTSLDGILSVLDWSNPLVSGWIQGADAILTAIFTIAEMYPIILVAFAVRKRLDVARWLVAITAALSGMLSVIRIAVQQGARYTHWTLGEKIGAPLFTINGNVFNAQLLANTLLLLAIVYAVYRYVQESAREHSKMEQEFKSARELQQVLIPENLPELPGFAFTTAYRPAQEVGGDFFQIIPLEGDHAGSTLILLGDVSGKGLKAAMTVSLIVGAARTLAKFAPQPAELLNELNQRLAGRLDGGFVTCLAMSLGPDGKCVLASAGHPAPYLNKRELDLPGSLPLGVLATATYEEKTITLQEGDHFALYTDGLLEARGVNGEIFSFERLTELFASHPDAAKATEAAVDFGQEDDITVLTLTRLATREKSSTRYSAPQFLGT